MKLSTLQLYGLPDKDFYKDGYFYGNLSDRPMTSDATDYADRAFRRITYNVSGNQVVPSHQRRKH